MSTNDNSIITNDSILTKNHHFINANDKYVINNDSILKIRYKCY